MIRRAYNSNSNFKWKKQANLKINESSYEPESDRMCTIGAILIGQVVWYNPKSCDTIKQ